MCSTNVNIETVLEINKCGSVLWINMQCVPLIEMWQLNTNTCTHEKQKKKKKKTKIIQTLYVCSERTITNVFAFRRENNSVHDVLWPCFM